MTARLALWLPLPLYLSLLLGGTYLPWHSGKLCWALLLVVTLMLLAIARYNLGSSFSLEPKATRLITTGLYKRLGHPVYIFNALLMFSTVLYLNIWWLFLPLGYLFARQVDRAHAENVVLFNAFPVEWVAWRSGTWDRKFL